MQRSFISTMLLLLSITICSGQLSNKHGYRYKRPEHPFEETGRIHLETEKELDEEIKEGANEIEEEEEKIEEKEEELEEEEEEIKEKEEELEEEEEEIEDEEEELEEKVEEIKEDKEVGRGHKKYLPQRKSSKYLPAHHRRQKRDLLPTTPLPTEVSVFPTTGTATPVPISTSTTQAVPAFLPIQYLPAKRDPLYNKTQTLTTQS